MFNKFVWKRFLIVLKDRDLSALIRAFVYVVFRFLGLISAFPAILILWVLKPVFWLKIGRLSFERIGHLSLNTDLFLRRRQLGIHPDGPYYCFLSSPKGLSNRQLLTMLKRVIPVFESHTLTLFFSGMLPLFKRTPFYQDLPMNSNEYYEFNNAKPSIYFTPDEIEKGRKLLSQMNVDLDKGEFVCIFSRDDAYLKHINPYNNWDYQNARDSDIDILIETAKYLIEKGFTVIRIGSIVKKPINFSHEKLIDYPYSNHQSDFLDIFLLAQCKFILAAGSSGLINVGNLFDKPTLTVSLAEQWLAPWAKDNLYIPKKFKYRNSNDYLRFEDALKLGEFWHNPAAHDLEATEMSSHDILEVTKEMLARLENTFNYSPESKKLIEAYHKLWSESGVIGSQTKTPIGIAWLKKNQSLYFSSNMNLSK
jgi:putative glycosyltransferase (TIGR04372 family)